MYDVVIIGGGPAGLTAAIYAGRKGLKTLLLEGELLGGNMTLAHTIENYPGFESISGMELAERMVKQAEKYAEIKLEKVIEIGERYAKTEFGTYETKTLIIATGTTHRKLNIPGEKELLGKGVSYCATCDAPMFQGKKVAVIGGGNSALSAALYLNEIAEKVYLIHRRDEYRGDKVLVEKVKSSGIQEVLNTVVEKINGTHKVESITIKNLKTNEKKEIDVDGVFIYIGTEPITDLVKPLGVELDKGFIKVDRRMRTNIPWIFACGDVTGIEFQIAKAVGEGCIAALSAYKHIKGEL